MARLSGLLGKLIGLAAFLLGTILLLVVFWQSWLLFNDPWFTKQGGVAPSELPAKLSGLIARLAFLLAMCIAASLITSKGISLYSAGVVVSHSDTKTSH